MAAFDVDLSVRQLPASTVFTGEPTQVFFIASDLGVNIQRQVDHGHGGQNNLIMPCRDVAFTPVTLGVSDAGFSERAR